MKVIIADNNEETLQYLYDMLDKEGLSPLKAKSGDEALELYKNENPDFICLDIMMEDMNGYDICSKIRKTDSDIPIIFISSKSEPIDKILGLELGADDYITKPFDVGEVLARIRALSRRCISRQSPEKVDETFSLHNIEILPNQLRAKHENGNIIDLSMREVKILRLFHKNKNNIVSRDQLLDYCWGRHIMTESRTVDWHISQLRKHIEPDPKNPTIIQTVHGAGYKYEE